MRKIKFLGVFVVLLQAVSFAQAQKERPSEEAACGASNSKVKVHTDRNQHPLGTADSGQALIYIIEEQQIRGQMTIATRYGVDGQWVGGNSGTSYFFTAVDPGEHHLCGEWETKPIFQARPLSMISFSAKSGEVYYFRVQVGAIAPSLMDLQPINTDEGKFLISKSAFSITAPASK
jgi:hypothetical protein